MVPLTPELPTRRVHGPRTVCAAVLTVVGIVMVMVAGGQVVLAEHSSAATGAAKPRITGSPAPTPSATPPPSVSTTPPTSSAPSPTTATAPTASVSATASSTPTSSPTSAPLLSCASDAAVSYGGTTYCAGYVVGVTTNAYGAGSRVVLPGATVLSVDGATAVVTDGTHCLPDPSGATTYCGALLDTLSVDFSGSEIAVPAAGDVLELFGVTDGPRGLRPVGYIVTGWSDPMWWT